MSKPTITPYMSTEMHWVELTYSGKLFKKDVQARAAGKCLLPSGVMFPEHWCSELWRTRMLHRDYSHMLADTPHEVLMHPEWNSTMYVGFHNPSHAVMFKLCLEER